jgi:hypothetical protein
MAFDRADQRRDRQVCLLAMDVGQMTKVFCQRFPDCTNLGEANTAPVCTRNDCLGASNIFFHAMPKPDACDHDFTGWREFEDGHGGEQVCSKCGMGAMAYSLFTDT